MDFPPEASQAVCSADERGSEIKKQSKRTRAISLQSEALKVVCRPSNKDGPDEKVDAAPGGRSSGGFAQRLRLSWLF
jgi:hypothetical protein